MHINKCVYSHIYIYIYIHIYVYIYTIASALLRENPFLTSASLYTTPTYLFTYIHIHIHININKYICIYKQTHVYHSFCLA
jgi:hypothetical protein